MGKSNRDNLYHSNASPGPGAYEQKSKVIEGPKCSISGRYAQSAAYLGPGPGQYNPDYKVRQSSTGFKYGTSSRPATAAATGAAPGPGSYDSRGFHEHVGGRFGKDTRKDMSQSYSHGVPGPGAYDAAAQAAKKGAAPKYTFGGKSSDGRVEAGKGAPGPGAYNLGSSIGKEGVKTTIASRKGDTGFAVSSAAPGPGAYSPSLPRDNGHAYRYGRT